MAERYLTMQRELMCMAMIDPLTSVFNRRAFFERAKEANAHTDVAGTQFCVMVDIDFFKRINDQYGHAVGDVALRGVAQKMIGKESIVGRLGGEEFAILIRRNSISEAVETAEQLRGEFAALRFDTEKGALTLTCSLGVSEWRPDEPIDEALKRADAALYDAKTGGRNRVVTASVFCSATGSESRKVRAASR
jgi:two-component system, cell cycle response regulator